ncbi:uncharacterized protein LOC144711381 [Wolffia australiana]
MEDQGVWTAVQPAPDAAVDLKLDRKAKAHLLQALPENILMQVAQKKTSKEIWEALSTRFVGADRIKNARLRALKRDFDAMLMIDGESLDDYAGRLSMMSVRYTNVGGTLDDTALVKKLFDTVPDRYLPIIAGVEQFCDIDTMLFEEALSRLKAFDERTCQCQAGGGVTIRDQLLLTQAEWEARQKKGGGDSSSSQKGKAPAGGGNCGRGSHGRGRGHSRGGNGEPQNADGSGGSGGGGRDKSHIRYFNCSEMGHYSMQYKALKKEEVHLTQTGDIERALLLAVSEELSRELITLPRAELSLPRQTQQTVVLLNEEKVWPELLQADYGTLPTSIWFLDNGASNHMTRDKNKFRELDEAVTGKGRFGDGRSVEVKGK